MLHVQRQGGPKSAYPVAESARSPLLGLGTALLAGPSGTATTPAVLAPDSSCTNHSTPTDASTAISTAAALTSSVLPGSASRISVDLSDTKQQLYSSHQLCSNSTLDTDAPALRHSMPAIPTEPPSATATQPRSLLPPLILGASASAAASSATVPLDIDRMGLLLGNPSGRRNMRASVDAASGAELLATRQASAASVQQEARREGSETNGSAQRGQAGKSPDAGYGLPRFSNSAPSSPAPHHDWSFGENLQRLRMKARYAAMDAADEIRYETPSGGDDGGDLSGGWTGGGGGGGGWVSGAKRGKRDSASGKQRKSWTLFRLFGSGGSGGKAAAASAAVRQASRRQFSRRDPEYSDDDDGGDSDSGYSDAFSADDEYLDDEEPMPVEHSRDSRVVYRARLGLDGRPGHRLYRALQGSSTDSAEDDQHDEVDAAVAAAAAAFATAASAVSVTGPNGLPLHPALQPAPPPPPRRRVRFRRPLVTAVHYTKGSGNYSEDSDRSSGSAFGFIGRLRLQLRSLSGSIAGAKSPPSQPPHQYRAAPVPKAPPPLPVHSNSAPTIRLGGGGGGGGNVRIGGGGGRASSHGGPGLLSEFRRSFRSKAVLPVAYDSI